MNKQNCQLNHGSNGLHTRTIFPVKAFQIKETMIFLLLFTGTLIGYAQTSSDTLREKLETLDGRLNSLDERVTVHESDLGKLNKIKVSGYIQAQFETTPYNSLKPTDPENTFYIRRARVKFTYEAVDGVKFVLQPDFSTGSLSLKDAYAMASLPKISFLSLWAGQFNRPSYEVEYSSSQREVLERSRVIRSIYPGEREVGVKLEFIPLKTPLKMQLAVLNGNFTGNQQKDVDTRKDLMARAVYSFGFSAAGIGLDIGAHGYYGGLMSKTKYVSDYTAKMDSSESNYKSNLDKQWVGAEIQMFFDILGGMALKGEYLAGKNATAGTSKTDPYKTRKFAGYYVYFIKNIGKKNQFVARYDYYDPNTRLSGDDAKKEVYYQTLSIAWQYYLNDFIRFSVNYEMPRNETNSTYPKDIRDDVFGIRMQAKF
jgi:phosphate-selective porin